MAELTRPLHRDMNNIDYAHLDGKLLQLLVALVEEGSVTRAALRLGVSQSAVSHLIGKLRAIVGDPLVVKSGRGIVATVRAEKLAVQARELLETMRQFAVADDFDPATLRIASAKFLSPALPGETLGFSLQERNKGSVQFDIRCGERMVATGSLAARIGVAT